MAIIFYPFCGHVLERGRRENISRPKKMHLAWPCWPKRQDNVQVHFWVGCESAEKRENGKSYFIFLISNWFTRVCLHLVSVVQQFTLPLSKKYLKCGLLQLFAEENILSATEYNTRQFQRVNFLFDTRACC